MACLSVSQLNELARESLQTCFDPEVWVKGEIHGFKVHAKSGHLYFDLVEKAPAGMDGYIAKISCAFFRGPYVKWRSSLASFGIRGFDLNSGIEIKLKGRIDLFVKEGRYQLIVSDIDPAYTLGAIAKKREQTIAHLHRLSLMDRNKMQAFPELPLNIGLITSEGSAAFSDFMRIITDSGYSFSITLFDAHMQGENTVPEVLKGIRVLQNHPGVDVIAIIRGGGSKTDLFSFDDIEVCKAIALCEKPVITGIGHEIDVSVADLVAHTYCVTPTDVARFFVGRADEVWGFLSHAGREMSFRSREVLRQSGERLHLTASSLDHISRRWMVSVLSSLKSIAFSLHTAVAKGLARREQVLVHNAASLKSHADALLMRQLLVINEFPLRIDRDMHTRAGFLEAGIHRAGQGLAEYARAALARQGDRLSHLDALVTLMDPAETLKRGYSMTIDGRGRIVRDAASVEGGECITTVLAEGKIRSVVKDKES
ncbi:MAG TPA: exodeoxyribonuclease VII large subunit [Deltaproteobacteria bacterium]|jgi:exodeoxyribonuclease VII large subunit|nr:exodeoxyribonuclease VII large subunit [Deltaproteobacteria bacterium]